MEKINDLYDKALDLLDQSKYEEALKLFYIVIDLDPSDEESWYHIGFIHLYQNDLKEALFSFKSALIINPEFIDAWHGIGIIYDNIGLFEEAIKAYSIALDEDPEIFASDWFFYIDNLIKNEHFLEASKELLDLIEFCNILLLEEFYFKALEKIEIIKEFKKSRAEDKKIKKHSIELYKDSIIQQRNYKDALNERGICRLYYICDFLNIPSIFRNGILSRNYIKKNNIRFNDISDYYVQKYRIKYMKENYNKEIHDFACLFFTPHTPMLRNVCFSQYKDNEVAILQLDPNLMDNVDIPYFTDKSCARRDFKMFKDIDDLEKLNWEYLTKDYDYLVSNIEFNEKKEFKGCRGAEVLIPDKIEPSFIIPEIIVKSQKAESVLTKLLNKNNLKNVQIIIDVYKFPLRTSSNAYRKKMKRFRKYY